MKPKKQRRNKVKELNILLDRAEIYMNGTTHVFTDALKQAAHIVANGPLSNRSDIDAALAAVNRASNNLRFHLDTLDSVGRPLEQKADGLYYTGRDR